MNKQIDSIPFFFIIGRPRSGTTLVQSIFDAHPNITIPGESKVMVRLYLKYRKIHVLDDATIDMLVEEVKKQPKMEHWPIDYQKLKRDLQTIKGKFNYQNFIKIVYLNFQSAFEKNEILMIGDKNPDYSKFPRLIFKIFPDTKFIYIIRDYRDNYLSVRKTGLLHGILPWIITRWIDSVKQLDKLAKKHPDQFYTVKYEEFIQKPDYYLKEMSGFLGVPNCEDILDRYLKNKEATEKYGEKKSKVFHSKIYQAVDPSNFGKWKKQLTDEEVMIIDRIVGKRVANMAGYEQKYTQFPFRIHLHVIPRMLIIRLFLIMKSTKKLFPQKHRTYINNKYPTLDKVYHLFFKK